MKLRNTKASTVDVGDLRHFRRAFRWCCTMKPFHQNTHKTLLSDPICIRPSFIPTHSGYPICSRPSPTSTHSGYPLIDSSRVLQGSPGIIGFLSIYIWCAATDPGDLGVFISKKYGKISNPGSTASVYNANTESRGGKVQSEVPLVTILLVKESRNLVEKKSGFNSLLSFWIVSCSCFPFAHICTSTCAKTNLQSKFVMMACFIVAYVEWRYAVKWLKNKSFVV